MPEPVAANPEDTNLMRAARRSRSDSPRKSWYAVQNDEAAHFARPISDNAPITLA